MKCLISQVARPCSRDNISFLRQIGWLDGGGNLMPKTTRLRMGVKGARYRQKGHGA